MLSSILWGIVIILVILWLVLWLAVHITSGFIHILIVIAAIVLIYNLVMGARGRRTL